MESLEEIKKRKLQEMMDAQQQQAQEQAHIQKQVHQLGLLAGKYLTKEALERYGNLKTAHPEKAVQLLVVLVQLIQQGQIQDKVDDEMLKKILKQLTPEKRDIQIKRV